jgi:hypothetical protein
MVMVAPGNAAPLESCTLPKIVPDADWPNSDEPEENSRTAVTSVKERIIPLISWGRIIPWIGRQRKGE